MSEQQTDTGQGTEAQPAPYDLADPGGIGRSWRPTVDTINERFAKQLEKALGSLLQRDIELSVESLHACRYADFAGGLSVPASLSTVTMDPMPGRALLCCDQRLLFLLTDLFFAGEGVLPENVTAPEFTPCELRVAALFRERVFAALKEAWSLALPLEIEEIQVADDPKHVRFTVDSEQVLVSAFAINGGETPGFMNVVLPASMIEAVRYALDRNATERDPDARGRQLGALQNRLREIRIELRGSLASTELNVKEVLALKEGDIIPVPRPDFSTLHINGLPLFQGQTGIHNNMKAIKIVASARNH